MHSTVYAGLLCALAGQSMAVVWESAAGGVPNSWSLVDKPSTDTNMALSIALTRKNFDKLEAKLAEVSTPGKGSYGKWLSKDDIDTHFPVVDDAPVMKWLKSAGITNVARDGAVVSFSGSVDKINKLLDTSFAYYKNGDSVKLRTAEYSIPDHLTDHIDVISPTVYFGKTRSAAPAPIMSHHIEARKTITTEVDASCQKVITPSCLKQMYNVGDYQADPAAGSRIGFGSFLNQSAIYADLETYEKTFNIPSQSFTVEVLNGGVNNQSANVNDIGEANLDVQNIVGVAHPLPVHEYITGGVAPFIPDADEPTEASDSNEPYLIFYEYLLSKHNSELPQVISNSYGDDEQTVPIKYAQRVCNLIGLNTLRGLTILHSSGDEGVGSACQSRDGKTPQFQPIFPATCPYVTAVGGTSDVMPEVAWNASSGGFSSIFPRAWYQYPAVEGYLEKISKETKKYYGQYTDFNGRGFPDVSAHSLYPDYEIIYQGRKGLTGGTSAAAPVFAAIVGLLNDARLRAGKGPLGFLNPFLYSLGQKGLNDITGGSSYGCGGIDPQSDQPVSGSLVIPGAHWNATEGWDPVTGLGTPDFQKLKDLVMWL
ncbi:Tripeptidyl-peptidase sed4 [Penicillium oxalicum]|uniref:Tripeptidyl-peptidase sed4 n=1 Tax=Penicillium oxalicum TaxID=69781 RepID=UPI0020B722B2|nr:Tripeptidyl-peptidase sed4 [Penicillium oxalicum]KAI2786276.1 Tripeptidyl-peptidase sed4 [Penicillium oxalicum]